MVASVSFGPAGHAVDRGQYGDVPDQVTTGNPVGEAVVWWVWHRGAIIISCFVPANGA